MKLRSLIARVCRFDTKIAGLCGGTRCLGRIDETIGETGSWIVEVLWEDAVEFFGFIISKKAWKRLRLRIRGARKGAMNHKV